MINKNANDEKSLIKIDKPLKKLKRNQLLELLLDALEENERLRQENQAIKEKYNEKIDIVKKSGSLAEASLKLTNIFEEAQKAINIYVRNIQDENVSKIQIEDKIEEDMYSKFSNESNDLYNQNNSMTEQDENEDYEQNLTIFEDTNEDVKVKPKDYLYTKSLEKNSKRGKHTKPRLLNY